MSEKKFKKTSILDELSWNWVNESNNMVLDKYGIIELYERIKDMKEELENIREDNEILEKENENLRRELSFYRERESRREHDPNYGDSFSGWGC